MDTLMVPAWTKYVALALISALGWVIRGYATDVRKIKATYMTRAEVQKAISENAEATAKLIAAHQTATAQSFADLRAAGDVRQTETTANFRELRLRLDQLNDTLLKVALK